MLTEHLKTKEEDRNQSWDEKFFKILSESELKIMSEDPQQGPDGWPYLISETLATSTDDGDKIDSAQKFCTGFRLAELVWSLIPVAFLIRIMFFLTDDLVVS